MEKHAFTPERCSLSWCCDLSLHVFLSDTTEHVLRPHTGAHRLRTHTHTLAGRHSCSSGIRSSSLLVCLRHNKQEWNCEAADTPLRIPNEQQQGEEGGRETERGPIQGAPNRLPSEHLTRTAVTARDTSQTTNYQLNKPIPTFQLVLVQIK